MAKSPLEAYQDLVLALEDTTLSLHALLDESQHPVPLDRHMWDRLMRVIEDLEDIQTSLEEDPEAVWRAAQQDQLHEHLDTLERELSS